MTKTLVFILNHNLPEETDDLYQSLQPFQDNLYDLKVMDNGSKSDFRSVHTSYQLEENVFWGGALNEAFRLVLADASYDSLLFLNNDIELNGENFVKSLRSALFDNDLAIVSPCMAGKANPWRQMMNWGTKGIRIVDWIDNQAPLFHRKLIEEIGQFDEQLIYGWGQELVCKEYCDERGWKIGVCDYISILHYGHLTFKKKRFLEAPEDSFKDFSVKAYDGFKAYFSADLKRYNEMHQYGNTYAASDIQVLSTNQKKRSRNLLRKFFE